MASARQGRRATRLPRVFPRDAGRDLGAHPYLPCGKVLPDRAVLRNRQRAPGHLKERFIGRNLPLRRRARHTRGVRRIIAVVVVVATASAVAVVALASTSAAGLPSYTNGYAKWPRINKKPFTSTGPLSSAHVGREERLREQEEGRQALPERHRDREDDRQAGDEVHRPVRRHAQGRRPLAIRRVRALEPSSAVHRPRAGAALPSCHMAVRANDYVFTKR